MSLFAEKIKMTNIYILNNLLVAQKHKQNKINYFPEHFFAEDMK